MGYTSSIMLQPQPQQLLLPQVYAPVDAPCASSPVGQDLSEVLFLEAQEAEVDAAIARLLNIRQQLASLRTPPLAPPTPAVAPVSPTALQQLQLQQLMLQQQQQQALVSASMALPYDATAAAAALDVNMFQAGLQAGAPYLQVVQQQPVGSQQSLRLQPEVAQLLFTL